MQDFVRYKVQILKNAAYKVVFLSTDIDTQTHVNVQVTTDITGIPIITILGGQLNVEALTALLHYYDIATIIASGLQTDVLLAVIASIISEVHVSVNSTASAQALKRPSKNLSMSTQTETNFSITVWDKIERELSASLNTRVSLDQTLHLMNRLVSNMISAHAIDITSDSTVDIPVSMITDGVFIHSVLAVADTELPNAQTVSSGYLVDLFTNMIHGASSASTTEQQASVEIQCAFGLLGLAELHHYDEDTVGSLDSTSLQNLKYTEIL